jgi:DNA polymerase
MKTIAIDTECYYDKEVSIKPWGAWHYVRHPKADHYLLTVSEGTGEAWAGRPEHFAWEALRGNALVAHNMSYDEMVLERLVELGHAPPWVVDLPRRCTADLAAYNHSGRSLLDATQTLAPDLVTPVDKTMRTWMKGRTWAMAEEAGKAPALLDYARNDAVACQALWDRLNETWPAFEQRLSEHTRLMGRRGISIDTSLTEQYQKLLVKAKWEAEQRIPWAGDHPPLSPKQLGVACAAANIPAPASMAEDSPECEAWEAKYGEQFEWVAAMRDWRKTNKMLTQVETILRRTRPDGTMAFSLKYGGAHTLRWSGESGFNMQNLPREASYGVDLRKCFVARPGHTFIICDLAQIEPRVLAWLAGDKRMLDAVRSGFPIYEAHARATMGWTGGKLKDEDKRKYSLAKARCLGLGYGCGANKFMVVAKKMAGLDLGAAEAERLVTEFRASNPLIVNLWRKLDRAVRASRGGTVEFELPSGRTLRQFDVACRDNSYWARNTRGEPHRKIYGGLATENVTQATARDVFGEALLRVEEKFPVVLHVHDEVVCEVPVAEAEAARAEIIRLMSQTPAWLPGCPINAEAVVSPHYVK